MSVSACSSTAMHFLTGSAKWDFDSDVISLGVLEKPARDWSEAFAIVVREVVIVRGRVGPQPGGWVVANRILGINIGWWSKLSKRASFLFLSTEGRKAAPHQEGLFF